MLPTAALASASARDIFSGKEFGRDGFTSTRTAFLTQRMMEPLSAFELTACSRRRRRSFRPMAISFGRHARTFYRSTYTVEAGHTAAPIYRALAECRHVSLATT